MNVKQGNLAIIIKATVPENVGQIVAIRKFIGLSRGLRGVWLVEAARPLRGVDGLGVVTEGPFGYVPDACLRPVSGLPVEEYDRLMEKEPA